MVNALLCLFSVRARFTPEFRRAAVRPPSTWTCTLVSLPRVPRGKG